MRLFGKKKEEKNFNSVIEGGCQLEPEELNYKITRLEIPQDASIISNGIHRFHQLFLRNEIDYDTVYNSIQGTFAYMKHADTYKLRKEIVKYIEEKFPNQISAIEINRYIKIWKQTVY